MQTAKSKVGFNRGILRAIEIFSQFLTAHVPSPRTAYAGIDEGQSAPAWPKTFPSLTTEQKRISDEFMKHWHEVLPRKFGIIDKFNHGYAVTHAPRIFKTTLE